MTDVGVGLTGLATLIALIAVRVPIGIALIAVSFTGLYVLMGPRVAWGSMSIIPYKFTSSWILSSIPMFLFLGFISYHTQLTRGMFNAARIWLASLPGGLAIASIFGSAGFAAVSGSSIACSAAMGRIAIPEMMKHRYHPELATGTVAVAGTIGALIPPSIILILYGVIAQISISALFLGGIVAGLMTAVGYTLVVLLRVWLNPDLAPERDASVTMREKLLALRETWPILLIMIGIFGGLFGGVFTPTEAGAVGASLACLVAIISGQMTLDRFLTAARETLMTTAALLIIAIGASLLTRFLALSGAGDYLSGGILSIASSPVLLMIGIVCVYLLMGMFLEPIGAMLLTLPIILPVVDASGWSLLWFGIVLTKLLEIGMITPPIGMNVFVIKSVVGDLVKTSAIFRGVAWFIVMDLVLVAILCAFPGLVLWLPNLAG
ncbi:TRAP transporter large permease [Lutimaribacter sp. EGI FJ00015]|uniref:TRAP transporter large permease n=1 Tax=Lutimaribacter degradans TaxID=2945989 RepID=A0ACC6A1A5_9RHOB|nr:TRAP transporter large permease [Lutimaribacter sp. EGI FJ00013]MCM2563384.1 TRAP transporter large permease [Lutimaribacter sp. EGI FJ00013]MCO0614537.1 TRAP transporter large permease [Lutimaribacter sp. EGI FJ00015]MCO0637210.1 TRAP transporter large permease [Lutimaribacter sp. EGI FJ00014]